ncbi:hypothetical protein NHP190002_12350 [Helicobacter ailurogastricus]|nr:hypothetical protein NHP190002_12350 [Helicobacter ailurogastricus]
MVVKYNHLDYLGIKTIWDGVSFLIAPHPNLQNAKRTVKRVALKYSKHYIDEMHKKIMEKEINSIYDLRKVKKVCPRAFFMPEKEGVRLYVFYITEPHKALESRSNISVAIIEELKNAGFLMFDAPKKDLEGSTNNQPETKP